MVLFEASLLESSFLLSMEESFEILLYVCVSLKKVGPTSLE